MIIGAHAIVYSKDPEADRAFLREVLRFPHVDVGGGWLIFGLPPAEVAVHPAEDGGRHELYLMCDDVGALVAEMVARGVACAPVTDQRWGLLTELALPGGGKLGVYEPRHPRPPATAAAPAPRKAKPRAKKAAAKAKPKARATAKAKAKPKRRR
ncbi:MAG TPA: extradiol dioxygenase [Polyangia bacterium]|nr:extradiol dioxygenase [Polyangia bacterium]